MTSNAIYSDDTSSDSEDSNVATAFASIDLSGVNFDVDDVDEQAADNGAAPVLNYERRAAFGDFEFRELSSSPNNGKSRLGSLAGLLATGKYAQALGDGSETARDFFAAIDGASLKNGATTRTTSVSRSIRRQVIEMGEKSVEACVEMEFLGIAALNLFLQGNYTGPSLDDDDTTVAAINPHPCFADYLQVNVEFRRGSESSTKEEKKDSLTTPKRNTTYQNAVLSELAVDGEWPCQVCCNPYFLLVARSILLTLSDPLRANWMGDDDDDGNTQYESPLSPRFVNNASKLSATSLWSGRAVIAHERLLQAREPSVTLWKETEAAFQKCIDTFCHHAAESYSNREAATVMLEWGLAQHHFDRPGKGKKSFEKARQYSGLDVEVTGAVGKRTKFQQQATAQMLVRAKSAKPDETRTADGNQKDFVKEQMIEHSEDGILLEKIKFDDEKENEVQELNILDQSILLALCLDVKNSNPADGLTGEEMGAFLSRVLDHHDDWMVYSTALLERAWLEFERSHARERSILQMQALADQHTNRLTITQSTRESVEQSAPVEQRLRNLHSIVYPPRWLMIQDLADRYAALGIVTSAAELFTEIEFWDSVVECYQRAGRVSQAEQIVRERLAVDETPRMWTALGDLTKDPQHYQKAVDVSKGRFADAYLALGAHYTDNGDLATAAENFEKALKVRPLNPAAWFRLGTISMQLKRWQNALRAFSEVVMQEPEEADAWANIAAIHMHNKQPAEAYPALNESLKHKRSNWRVWVSKLYTCLDLKKFDEAIQACNVILDLRPEKQASEGIPFLEEKCVRAIVGGSLKKFHNSKSDEVALDSARRTLDRVQTLLERISSSSDAISEAWVFDTMAYFHQETGQDPEKVLDSLMKEYRSIQTKPAWEKDDQSVRKLCDVVSRMVEIYKSDLNSCRESLTKARFLVRGVVQKIKNSRPDDTTPDEVERLQDMLTEIETKLQELTT